MPRPEPTALATLSNDLAALVDSTSATVVSVEGRGRLPSSGILLDRDIVVTAAHTIQRTEEIPVHLPGEGETSGTLAGIDRGTDLAVLRLGEPAPAGMGRALATPAGSGDEPRAGHLVVAVGRSPRNGTTASLGVLSCASGPWRTMRGGKLDRLLRIDIGPYPGLSGGAVVAARGALLGLATTALTRIGAIAIPMETVHRVAADLLAHGRVARPYLGVGLQPVAIPSALRSDLALEAEHALIILAVESGSPAHQGGLMLGDVLLSLNGAPLQAIEDVQAALESAGTGAEAQVGVIRAGALANLTVALRDRPARDA